MHGLKINLQKTEIKTADQPVAGKSRTIFDFPGGSLGYF